MSRAAADTAGQATIELVAALPLLLAVAAAVVQVLAAGVCREAAASASEAGARAMLQGGDPRRAARGDLPGWARGGSWIHVHGRRIEVRIAPPRIVPVLGALLQVHDAAEAGPVA